MKYPRGIEKLIEFYQSLPGIGEKNAVRMALSTFEMDDNTINSMIDCLKGLKINIKKCRECGCLSDNDLCDVCSNSLRNKEIICVVEDYKSLVSFEKSGTFNGVYHVLGGLISPMDGINPNDLSIDSLINRIKSLDNPEVILALRSSIDGEMTMLYLKNVLADYNVKVSRLSYGVPIGMNFDYMDMISLDKALEDRKDISGNE